MVLRKELVEATALLDGILNLLLRSATSKTGRGAYALRTAVGFLQANAENSIRALDIGDNLRICFTAALAAGATFEGMDAVRRYIAETEVEAEISDAIASAGTIMCLAAMSTLITNMTFRSRDDVQVMVLRMRAALDPMKEEAADDLPAAVYQALNALGATIMWHLAKTELQLPRKIQFRFAVPLPVLTLSHKIYQDTERWSEIADENKVIHPAFCPRTVIALSQ